MDEFLRIGTGILGLLLVGLMAYHMIKNGWREEGL